MSCKTRFAVSFCALAVLLMGALRGSAEEPGSAAPTATSSPAGPKVIDCADNAWMLTASALVLMMTAPGLAMFYSGLVRKKNVLGVMMQCIFLMGLMSVVWALWGYSLSFGGKGKPWIGNGEYLLMQGVQAEWQPDGSRPAVIR